MQETSSRVHRPTSVQQAINPGSAVSSGTWSLALDTADEPKITVAFETCRKITIDEELEGCPACAIFSSGVRDVAKKRKCWDGPFRAQFVSSSEPSHRLPRTWQLTCSVCPSHDL